MSKIETDQKKFDPLMVRKILKSQSNPGPVQTLT